MSEDGQGIRARDAGALRLIRNDAPAAAGRPLRLRNQRTDRTGRSRRVSSTPRRPRTTT